MLYLENEAQIDQNCYGTICFMLKQVSRQKISLIPKKMKIRQKSIYARFCIKAFNKSLEQNIDVVAYILKYLLQPADQLVFS